MKIGNYEIRNIKAVAESAGDNENQVQGAVMVHLISDKFHDGDCILFGYHTADFANEYDITDALQNESPISDFYINEDTGVYFG